MPKGCIFADKGPAVFVEGDVPDALLSLCAVVNSAPFGALVALQLARTELAQSYEVGLIQQTPIPDRLELEEKVLASLARASWSFKRNLDTRTEHSHAFHLPALLQVEGLGLASRAEAWGRRVAETEVEVERLQAEIDEICFGLYGIDGADREQIERGLRGPAPAEESGGTEEDGQEDDEGEPEELDAAPLVASLLSWTVGAAFGRFDVRLATGERTPPPEPDPFDPLPVCSPGMLTGQDGLPLDAPPAGYPIAFPQDGILVDDVGAERDLVAASQRVFEVVFDDPHARWDEAAEILGDREGALRTWFAKDFFELHIKRYSKSRRRAPIYWQLATPSASYSAWLYYHRFTRDTLFRLLNDHVTPKLRHEERQLTTLIQEAGPTPTSSQRKAIAAQETFVEELRAFREEVARVAPLWDPDLNDGVILNFAPLWRLVPQHRGWQKQCKAAWDKLCAGDCDWAHLALRLWPERVVPKCAEDRSLAIAHGLEEVFWEENDGGKWEPKDVLEEEVAQLIAERTSLAVQDALHKLLSTGAQTAERAPASRTGSRPGRQPRATGASATGRPRPASRSREVDPGILAAVKKAIAGVPTGASKADVMAATGISAAQWSAAIKILLEQDAVIQVGVRRGARYHVAGGKF